MLASCPCCAVAENGATPTKTADRKARSEIRLSIEHSLGQDSGSISSLAFPIAVLLAESNSKRKDSRVNPARELTSERVIKAAHIAESRSKRGQTLDNGDQEISS